MLTCWTAAGWLDGFTQIHGTCWDSNCHVPWTSKVQPCTGYHKRLVTTAAPSAQDKHDHVVTDLVWPVQQHSVFGVEGWRLIEVAHTKLHCSSQVDWRWRRTPDASLYQCPHDVGVAIAIEELLSVLLTCRFMVSSLSSRTLRSRTVKVFLF